MPSLPPPPLLLLPPRLHPGYSRLLARFTKGPSPRGGRHNQNNRNKRNTPLAFAESSSTFGSTSSRNNFYRSSSNFSSRDSDTTSSLVSKGRGVHGKSGKSENSKDIKEARHTKGSAKSSNRDVQQSFASTNSSGPVPLMPLQVETCCSVVSACRQPTKRKMCLCVFVFFFQTQHQPTQRNAKK